MRRSVSFRLFVCAALVFSIVAVVPPGTADAVSTPSWRWLHPAPRGDTLYGVSMSPTTNSQVVWAVGEYGCVMKSYDDGNTWMQKSSGTTAPLMDVDMIDDNAGWAVGMNGTIIKITGGATCTIQAAPAGTTHLYAVDVVNATTAWAVGQDGDIIRTLDGSTWELVVNNRVPGSNFNAVSFVSATEGWVGGAGNAGGNTIFYTNDGGMLLWDKSPADLDFALEDFTVDLATNTLLAVGRHETNWTPLCYETVSPVIRQPNTDFLSYAGVPTPMAGGYLTAVSTIDKTHNWVVTSVGEVLFYNELIFTELNPVYTAKQFTDIDVRSDTSPGAHTQGVFVGYGGVAGRTSNGGTWAKRSAVTDEPIMAVDFISTTVGYATNGADIMKTADSGKTWSTLSTAQGSSLLDVDFLGTGKGWAVGRVGTALYNAGGAGWTVIGAGLDPTKDLYSVSYVDATHVWACGDDGNIYSGNGAIWTEVPDPKAGTNVLRGIDFFDTLHGIAVGNNGVVVYTTDGGTTWTDGDSGMGLNDTISGVDMVSATTGFMVGDDDGGALPAMLMRKTTDGGATWTPMTPPAGVSFQTLYGVSFADANNGWIVGSGGTLIHTTNGGSPVVTWTSEKMTAEALIAVSAVSPTAAWAVGFNGAILTNYVAPAPPAKTVVYRFYNVVNGTHFYTSNYQEKLKIIATWPLIYNFEGTGYEYDASKAQQPLYRFFNVKNGSHFYTASATEKALVEKKWPTIYTYEGPAYNVSTTPVTGDTVWRFYNLKNGSHFYTASAVERDMVQAKWPTVYKLEGPAFYLPQ